MFIVIGTTTTSRHIQSNYDSLFVRTVAFRVQVAYWIKEVMPPRGYSVPCQL